MLKEELVRKDRQLELTERKLKVLDSAYADMSEKCASSLLSSRRASCGADLYALITSSSHRIKVFCECGGFRQDERDNGGLLL